MAIASPSSNILIMGNGDTYTPNAKKIKIKGVRLVGGSDASTATISAGGKIVYSLAASATSSDECSISSNVDGDSLTAALTGTGSTLYVYLD